MDADAYVGADVNPEVDDLEPLLRAIRSPESGGRNIPNSMGSGAFGPYQFMPPTWDENIRGLSMDGRPLTSADRMNPDAQEYVMRQRLLPSYVRTLRGAGREVTPGAALMLHRLGEGGGPAMLQAAESSPDTTAREVLSQFFPSERSLRRVFAQNPYLGSYDNPRTAQEVTDRVAADASGDPRDPGAGGGDLPLNGRPGNITVPRPGGALRGNTPPIDPNNPTRPVTTPDDDQRVLQMRREIMDNLPTPGARREASDRMRAATENLMRSYQARRQIDGPSVPMIAAGAAMMQSTGPGGWGGVLRSIGAGGAAGARAMAGEREHAIQGDIASARVGQQGAQFDIEEQDRQYRQGLEGLTRAEQALLLPDRIAQTRAHTEQQQAAAALARSRATALEQQQTGLDGPPRLVTQMAPADRRNYSIALNGINQTQIARQARQEVMAEQEALDPSRAMTVSDANAEIARRTQDAIAQRRREVHMRFNAIDPLAPPDGSGAPADAAVGAPGAGAPPIVAPTPPTPAISPGAAAPAPVAPVPPAPVAVAVPPPSSVPVSPLTQTPPTGRPAPDMPPVQPGTQRAGTEEVPVALDRPEGLPAPPPAHVVGARSEGVAQLPPPPAAGAPTPETPADLARIPMVQATHGPDVGPLPPSPFAPGSPDRRNIESTQGRVMSPERRRAQAQELQRMTRDERTNIRQHQEQSESIRQALDAFETALDNLPISTGPLARTMVNLAQWQQAALGIPSATATYGNLAEAAMRYLQPRMRVQGSGSTSDNEMRWFEQSLPSLQNSPEGNRVIINMFRNWSRYHDVLSNAFSQAYADGNGLLGPGWFQTRDAATIQARAELRTLRSQAEEILRNARQQRQGGPRQSDRFRKGGLVPARKHGKLSQSFHEAFLNADR